MAGDVQGVVTTTAFGQGIDVGGVRVIIHNEALFDAIEYKQQSGRAGRDGALAYSYVFVNQHKQPIIPTPDLLSMGSLVNMIWNNTECCQISLTTFIDGPDLTKNCLLAEATPCDVCVQSGYAVILAEMPQPISTETPRPIPLLPQSEQATPLPPPSFQIMSFSSSNPTLSLGKHVLTSDNDRYTKQSRTGKSCAQIVCYLITASADSLPVGQRIGPPHRLPLHGPGIYWQQLAFLERHGRDVHAKIQPMDMLVKLKPFCIFCWVLEGVYDANHHTEKCYKGGRARSFFSWNMRHRPFPKGPCWKCLLPEQDTGPHKGPTRVRDQCVYRDIVDPIAWGVFMNPFMHPKLLEIFDFAENTEFTTYSLWAFKTVIDKLAHFNLVEIACFVFQLMGELDDTERLLEL